MKKNENNKEKKVEIGNNLLKSNFILKNMCQKNNFFPQNNNFNNDRVSHKKIPKNHNFEYLFPIFTSFCKNLDKNLLKELNDTEKKNLDSFIRLYVENKISNYDKEIDEFSGKYWNKLRKETKRHTSLFFYMAYEYINDTNFCDYDKNILFWTILFHDIGKHQIMNEYYDEKFPDKLVRDKAHPFKSIIIFIQSLINKNLIFFIDEENKNNFNLFFNNIFIDKLYKSFVKIKDSDYKNGYGYNISFINIETIEIFLSFLNKNEENNWIYEISILILFHQSLPNHNIYMNSPLLDEKYILKYFDIRLLELMRVIMVYDSCSHSLFLYDSWVPEINKNIDLLRKRLFDKDKKN